MAKTVYTDSQVVTQLDSLYHLTGTNLTYGFPTTSTWFPYGEATGFSALTTAQQAMATLAIKLWDDLIPVNFTYTANGSTATVKFSNTTTNIGYAQAYYPGSWSGASAVWFNPNYNSGTNNLIPPSIGAWGWSAFIHETGHAVGLSHPGTYNGGSPTYATDAVYMQDSQQYTIMSYFTANNTGADWVASNGQTYYAQTPMIDDIMTVQAIYGVSTTTRTGDTVYGFNSNAGVSVFDFTQNPHPVVAIFDSAGNDTLDLSGWNTPSLINLTPGSFSNSDMMTSNISIARTAWIENAVGGGGDDTLIGNILANVLTGNAGNDTFTGGAGNDTINGGIGTDTAIYSGALSNYTIVWNAGAGSYTVTDNRSGSPDGTDTLTGVENFTFSDQTVLGSLYQTGGTTIAIAATDASKAEGNSGTTPFTFTITRGGDTSLAGSVSWAVTGSGASPADATDFGGTLPTGTANFAAGQTTATVTVNVSGDTTVESTEGFTVTLSGASGGATITGATASGSIISDDTPPSLAITATDAIKSEGDSGTTPFTFTVTRTGDLSQAGTVNWAVTGSGSSAADATDFGGALPTGTASFAAGQATATVTVNVAGDATVESDEGITVTLSGASGGATISTATATGTILNNDGTFSIVAGTPSLAEGNSGATPFTFTVTRSGSAAAAATVNWSVSGITADATDFGGTLPAGTLNFAAGQTSATITVNVAGDTVVEGNETFAVTLSSPSGGTIAAAGTAAAVEGDFPSLPASLAAANGKSGGIGTQGQGKNPASQVFGASTQGNQPSGAVTIATATATATILNDDASLAISAASASKAEGNSGTTPFTFTVTRSGSTSAASSATWTVTGNGADATDFGGTLPTGTVNFAAGQTTATITVNVSGDTTVEGNEGFTVTLSNPAGATITTAAASGTILNDDASLAISADAASKAEGNSGTTPFTFTVTRSGDTSAAASANWTVTGNGADATDFGGTLPSGIVNFAAGQTTATITVNVSGDTTAEGNEGFTVTLSNPTGATITTAAASSTILNDDTSLAISADAASKAEGNSGTTPFTFTVTRSGDTSAAASATWTVTGNGADATDFGGTLPSGTVNFTAGQTSATITVNVSGDTTVEGDEGFTVTLSNPTGATIATAAASSTILNDDTVPVAPTQPPPAPTLDIAAASASLAEGNSGTTPFTFTVTRSGDTSAAASANWTVTGNGADATDFGGTLPAGTVNFAAGQTSATITVNVSGDTTVEGNEGFTVTLSNPAGATITTAAASGTILNDDASLAISADAASKAEGNSGTTPFTFTVTRSGDTSAAASANWTVTGNGADATDFGGTLPSGIVNFAAGQTSATVTVNVSGDTTVEGNEGFTVTLSNPAGATITTAAASSTILNDDASLAISADAASKAEGNSGTTPFTFTVTRSGDTSAASSATWTVTGNGADATDFGGTLPSGTVNFAAGQTSATITVNVSGDTTVEVDEGFAVTLSNPTGATIATAAASSTILNDDLQTSFIGTAGNDVLDKSAMIQNLTFDLSQGGDDTATGGTGNDSFILGGTFTALDSINGGAGTDSVSLSGNYATATTLSATSLTNVETLILGAGNSYNFTTNDGNVAAGAKLTVDATALASINAATVNGAAETNGTFTFLGGAGADTFTGGSGADTFRGGLGADVLTGGAGVDHFVYTSAADSALSLSGTTINTAGADRLVNFGIQSDNIDLSAFGFTGAAASVVNKATNGFTTTATAGFFGNSAVAVEYAQRGQTAQVYVDANRDGNLGAGDLLIQITGVTKGSLGTSNFTFA